jgi:hypothetical protein
MHCDIELPDNPTIKECIAYEKENLRFHKKCGSAGAVRCLKAMQKDLENYTFRSISIQTGVYVTVAEYRKHLEDKKADAAEEAMHPFLENDELDDVDDYIADGVEEPDDFHDRIADGVHPFKGDELDDLDEDDLFGVGDDDDTMS